METGMDEKAVSQWFKKQRSTAKSQSQSRPPSGGLHRHAVHHDQGNTMANASRTHGNNSSNMNGSNMNGSNMNSCNMNNSNLSITAMRNTIMSNSRYTDRRRQCPSGINIIIAVAIVIAVVIGRRRRRRHRRRHCRHRPHPRAVADPFFPLSPSSFHSHPPVFLSAPSLAHVNNPPMKPPVSMNSRSHSMNTGGGGGNLNMGMTSDIVNSNNNNNANR
jgi:hypothetical protein